MSTQSTPKQSETPKLISRLSAGEPSLLEAVAAAKRMQPPGLVYYRHGVGFGASRGVVYGVDWASTTQFCLSFSVVRADILLQLNDGKRHVPH